MITNEQARLQVIELCVASWVRSVTEAIPQSLPAGRCLALDLSSMQWSIIDPKARQPLTCEALIFATGIPDALEVERAAVEYAFNHWTPKDNKHVKRKGQGARH